MTGKFCAQCACYAATFSVVIGSLVQAQSPATTVVDTNCFGFLPGLPGRDTVNVAFCNGQVKFMSRSELESLGQPVAKQDKAKEKEPIVLPADRRIVQGPGLGCFSTIPVVNTFNYTSTPAKAKAGEKTPPPLNLMLAAKQGKVEAKVVARDANHVRVFLKNPGKTPLSVQLPEALAARPVLAQAGNFFNPGGGQGNNFFNQGNNNRGGGQPQAIAGPMTFNQSQNNNQGGNVFAIPPESVREIRVNTVCLEHGKPEPKSSVKYELVDFAQVGGTPQLEAVLVRYGRGDIDEQAVQAAAWHIANGKSWQELAAMSQLAALNAQTPVFTAQQLRAARQLVEGAEKFVAQNAETAERRAAETASAAELPAATAERAAEKSTKVRLFSTINARK